MNIVEIMNIDKDISLYFYCGICYKKKKYYPEYNDINKVILYEYSDKRFLKYARTDNNGNKWMKICFICKYKANLISSCTKCDYYHLNEDKLKHFESLKLFSS